MKEVIKSLESVLANSYVLSIKTQNYHWNVTGPNFKTLHLLFEEQYNELAIAIDEIAERIRMLGSKVDASFQAFAKLSQIKDGSNNLDSAMMIEDLAKSHHVIIKILKDGIQIAQKNDDEATADLFITRLEAHDKAAWMLEASI